MRKICRALVLCMLLLAAFDTTIAGLIAAVDKDHAVTMTTPRPAPITSSGTAGAAGAADDRGG
jgi:hypothetical protein